MSYQQTVILGNLGKDPEMKYSASGTAITTFSVAVSEKYGEGPETTEWYSVVAWDKRAETIAEHFHKGDSILVTGRMKTRSWDGPDGQKRYRTELICDRWSFAGAKRGGSTPAPDDMPFEP